MPHISYSIQGTLYNTDGTGSTALRDTFGPFTISRTQITKTRGGQPQGLTETWETIDLGELSTLKCDVMFANLDATYTIDIGVLTEGSGGTEVQFGLIDAGGLTPLFTKPAGVYLVARASGGSGATATLDVHAWSA